MLRNEKGLTLIEALAAVAIMGILAISFLNISSYVSNSRMMEQRNQEALRIAVEKLNQQRVQFASIPPVAAGSSLISFPDETVNGLYRVKIQHGPIGSVPNTSNLLKHQTSVQGIILIKDTANGNKVIPRTLTVTVSWGG